LEKVRLPPVEQLCVDFEAKLVEMVEEPTLWNEAEPIDVLEGCIAETIEFDAYPRPSTLNTGLVVKDAPCPEFLEGICWSSVFNLLSNFCVTAPPKTDFEILERQTHQY
jgi:hypothetical protein